MKKLALVPVLFMALSVAGLSAQNPGDPNPEQIGVDTAQQKLKEISISKFEDPGFWKVSIPQDHGVISHRKFQGNPLDKKPIPDEETTGIKEEDSYVLGVKSEFFGRTTTTLSIEPVRPLAVPGITKTISVWVVGRNFNHRLSVVVQDFFGHRSVLPMGKLNFTGWKKMTVAVPSVIEQKNPHYTNQIGIKILGFVVEPEMTETYGSYFVYFDDLRVVTDLFSEEERDPDDIADNW